MGRQAHLTRLALGRSAFDPLDDEAAQAASHDPHNRPRHCMNTAQDVANDDFQQQYSSRGYPIFPASRFASRAALRARNSVLSTAGVCINVQSGVDISSRSAGFTGTAVSKDIGKDEQVEWENEFGFWLDTFQDITSYIPTLALRALRLRLLTFYFYNAYSAQHIVDHELTNLGLLSILFAGYPNRLLFRALCLGMKTGLDLVTAWIDRTGGKKWRRKLSPHWLTLVKWSLEQAGFLLLIPIRTYSILQQLQLVPPFAIFPPFTAESYRMIFWSGIPHVSRNKTLLSNLAAISLSPVLLSYLYAFSRHEWNMLWWTYVRMRLPRPNHPDLKSKENAPDAGFKMDNFRYLFEPVNRVYGPRSKLQSWYSSIHHTLGHLRERWVGTVALSPAGGPHEDTLELVNVRPDDSHEGLPDSSEVLDLAALLFPSDSSQATTTMAEIMQRPQDAPGHDSPTPSSDDLSGVSMAAGSHAVGATYDNMTLTTGDLPPTDAGLVESVNVTAASVTSRTTIEMKETELDASTIQQYRVTALSVHSGRVMNMLLRDALREIALLPLEALVARTVAFNFLRDGDPPASYGYNPLIVGRSIFPLGAWFGNISGNHGRTANLIYTGHLALCLIAESVASGVVWQATTRFAIWSGKRYYSWGQI
ncbi:hypothetical protein MMC25_004808 [Agyrium rufum]|nr:hypothetical protein [Agyrium rufum]